MIRKTFSTAIALVLAAGLCPASALAEVAPQAPEQPKVEVQAQDVDLDAQAAVTNTVKLVDAITGAEIKAQYTVEGETGTAVAAPSITGYKLVSQDPALIGQEGDEIVFEYAKKVTVTVYYYRTVGGVPSEETQIHASTTKAGYEGEKLTVTPVEIAGYAKPKAQSFTPMPGEPNVVKFFYSPEVDYKVNYFLYKGGKTTTKVKASKIGSSYDGATVTAKAPEIFGYELVSAASKKLSVSEGGTNTVSFYYKKLVQKMSFETTSYIYYNHKVYKTTATTNKSAANTKLNDRLAQETGGRMVGFRIKNTSQAIKGDIKYQLYQRGKGWTEWQNGKTAGSYKNEKKNYSGQIIRVKLTEEFAQKYDVYYRAKIFGVGWTGWAKNGQNCGAKFDYSVHLRGIQVKLLPKGSDAPGTSKFRYVNEKAKDDFAKAVLYNKIQNKASRTKYIIAVNTEMGRVAVFQGSRGNWNRIKYWLCTSGQPGHLTPHGGYNVGTRGLHFGESHIHRGYHYTAWYWTQIKNQVLFHSVLYHAYSQTKQLPGGRGYGLGKRESGGCIRLEKVNAYWIYTQVPRGTDVWIF
ncbi:MAG: L,D-transpeptidase [Coriobacteriia bacterium]|nr:L,D-transpeptidase [Coriobacteriia bacterium]